MLVAICLRFWKQILIITMSFFMGIVCLFIFVFDAYQEQLNQGCGVPSSIAGNGNIEKGWNYFTQYYSKTSVSGILGNLMVESKMNPSQKQIGGGPGIGLAQWSIDGRWVDLVKYANTEGQDPYSLEVQLSFINVEMRSNKYGNYGDSFNNMSLEDSTFYFEKNYEVAGRPNMTDRNNYAKQIYNQFANAAPTNTTMITQNCGGTPDGSTAPNSEGSEPYYQDVMKVALQYKGMAYVWGGNKPIPGFDCSGLWEWSFKQIGILIPRTAQEQYNYTQRITKEELKPGDFIFFSGTSDHAVISHVGLYVGSETMYNANDNGVEYSKLPGYWENHIAGYGRLK